MTPSFTKAIIFDLDGTALPSGPKSVPSPAVIQAVATAQQRVHTLFATSRSWKRAKELAKVFGIQVPVVTLGGVQVVDPLNGKVLWEQDLDPGVAEKVVEIAKQYPGSKVYDYETDKTGSLKTYKVKAVTELVTFFISEDLVQDFVKQVKKIPLLLVETAHSFEKGMTIVSIKHIHATKFMALQTVAKKLGLNSKECVGIGDSANDITLLNFCGTKIAMGNATERLKELAHHIAPSVKEDGLAWVIEKFIMSDNPPPIPKKPLY